MNRSAPAIVAVLCGVMLCSCSEKDPTADNRTWHEISADMERQKQEKIQAFERQGLSHEEAEATWWNQTMVVNTETGHRTGRVTIAGSELQNALERPVEAR